MADDSNSIEESLTTPYYKVVKKQHGISIVENLKDGQGGFMAVHDITGSNGVGFYEIFITATASNLYCKHSH